MLNKYLTLVGAAIASSSLLATVALAKPDQIDGLNVPEGRIPQEIKDSRYPRSYYPNTEVGRRRNENHSARYRHAKPVTEQRRRIIPRGIG